MEDEINQICHNALEWAGKNNYSLKDAVIKTQDDLAEAGYGPEVML